MRESSVKARKSLVIKQMQPTAAGSSSSSGGGGGGGGGELNRAGLARFRSAPATWLEALLEEEEEDPLKPNQCLTQLLSSGDPGLSQLDQVGFPRQNSSPADLLDGYFPNYGIPASYDYLSPNIDVSPSNKRVREDNTQFPSPKFHTQSVNKYLNNSTQLIVLHCSLAQSLIVVSLVFEVDRITKMYNYL